MWSPPLCFTREKLFWCLASLVFLKRPIFYTLYFLYTFTLTYMHLLNAPSICTFKVVSSTFKVVGERQPHWHSRAFVWQMGRLHWQWGGDITGEFTPSFTCLINIHCVGTLVLDRESVTLKLLIISTKPQTPSDC